MSDQDGAELEIPAVEAPEGDEAAELAPEPEAGDGEAVVEADVAEAAAEAVQPSAASATSTISASSSEEEHAPTAAKVEAAEPEAAAAADATHDAAVKPAPEAAAAAETAATAADTAATAAAAAANNKGPDHADDDTDSLGSLLDDTDSEGEDGGKKKKAPAAKKKGSVSSQKAGTKGPDAAKQAAAKAADGVTTLGKSPEAHAEVDEMAQAAAREVLASRHSSVTGDAARPKPEPSVLPAESAPPQAQDRRASGTNVKPQLSPRPGTVESLQRDKVSPPSPSKMKTGPWLSGTFRLPKSGKIISGAELCASLERMTNAYIDKYMNADKGGSNTLPHIATGTKLFMSKKLAQDEYDAMISRLYKPKDRAAPDSDKTELMTLRYSENGKESWVPVKTVSNDEQTQYMCQLYSRCAESKKKTQQELADRYLQPLGKPRRF